MTAPPPPLGADGPDERLIAYVNGSLSPHEHDALERWLAANPAHRRRVEALRAVRAAVRGGPPGVDARPPAASQLTGLWAALDAASAASRPAAGPTPSAPPPVPAQITSVDEARRRRGRPRWVLAAAALVVVVAGVVAASAAPGDDGDRDGRAAPAGGGTGGESDADLWAALSRSAAVTSRARTANVTFRAVTDAELPAGPITRRMTGTGQVELPGRSLLDTRTMTTRPDGEQLLPPARASVVEDGDRTFVRCGGEAEYTEQDRDAAGCFTLALGPDVFGPDAAIDMIEEAEELPITKVGEDTIGGLASTGYQVVHAVQLDGESVPLAIQIWIDEDSLIRRIVGAARFGSVDTGFTALFVSYELSDYGVHVDIPDMD